MTEPSTTRPDADRQFVIIGAGLAGAKAAETLRDEGFAGRIVLIGDEPVRPYERPPLSKAILLGTDKPDEPYVHSAEWYADHDVDLRTGVAAIGIDRAAREVTMADGSRIAYDRLLLATGSAARRLDVPGATLNGVRYLRTLAEATELKRRLVPGARVVIIGAGWIGLEVAAAARNAGASVTVVEMATLPLQRVLGDEVATVFADLHRANGVDFRFGASVQSFDGDDAVESVTISGGETLPADLVVAGVGIAPNAGLAADAGLTVANGIRVDEHLRSSDPNIFAAGDVANAHHPLIGESIRVEHWANALNGGPAAARSMLDRAEAYDPIPYFFTDQYDLGCEYAGYVTPSQYDRVVFRGDPTVVDGTAPEFVAFWLSDDRVLAAMNVNVWDVQDELQRLVRAGFAGRRVDPEQLADPGVPLAEITTG
jgi:NADPH-dependent 2,4-dienoyl-CoA reductase/sulfur reductase-like enzyme